MSSSGTYCLILKNQNDHFYFSDKNEKVVFIKILYLIDFITTKFVKHWPNIVLNFVDKFSINPTVFQWLWTKS